MGKVLKRLMALFCIFVFASAFKVSAQEEPEGRPPYRQGDLPKLVSVIKTGVPPVIDGIMEEGEWKDAASITGLTQVATIYQQGVHGCACVIDIPERATITNVAEHQSTFWITYDEENLYIAHHSPPPPEIADNPAMIEVMLKNTQTRHDHNIEYDDSISIEIMHPVYPGGDIYMIQLNSIDTTFDCIWGGAEGNMTGTNLGWDPEVTRASTLTLDGWFAEVAIPWAEFGEYFQKPRPGQTMYLNLARVWRETMDEYHAWKGYDGFRPRGEVVFSGGEGVVVQLLHTGSPQRGQAAFKASIINFHNSETAVTVNVKTDTGELSETKDIVLAPGGEHLYVFESLLTDMDNSSVSLDIRYKDSGEPIHITTLPVIRPRRPTIETRRYMSLDRMKFETDISFIGAADLRRTSIGLTLVHRETGRRVLRRTFRGFASYRPVLELSTEDWAPGIYDAHFAISAPGMKRYETSVEYYHPELPEWWNNTYGFEDMEHDRVPYPWTNIEIRDDSINVWGRKYDMSGSFLPRQITTVGYPLLRAPMRIVAVTADGETIDSVNSDTVTEWTTTNFTRVEGNATAMSNGFSLRNDFWSEYDGLLWNKITIIPHGDVDIVSMELEIPLTEAFTDVINPIDYSMRTTGKLQEDGYVSEPTRAIWLGNADGGIQWFCETAGWFFVEKPGSSLRVEKIDGQATLRLTMIDIPTLFSEPHEIEFGFIATPVRPKTWRMPEHSRYRGVRGAMFNDPHHQTTQFTCGIENALSGLYVSPNRAGTVEELELFGDEWRVDPHGRGRNTTMASQSYRNYSAWRHWRRQHLKVCGDRAGLCRGFVNLYYDVTGAITSANPYVGTGYRKRDGTLAPTRPYLAEREITRRLYNITMSNPESHPRDSWIGYHNSSAPEMAYMSFANANWDAENFNSIINQQQQTYIGFVNPAMYRAEHLGHNFGWPLFFLGQGRILREWVEANGGPEAVFDHISGLDLLHDGAGVCCIMPAIEGARPQEMRRVRERMNSALEKHNLRHWIYQFIPYWQQDILELPGEKIYASLYVAKPSQIMRFLQSYDNDRRSPYWRLHGLRLNIASYFDPYPSYDRAKDLQSITAYNADRVLKARDSIAAMQDKAIIIFYNDSGWEGEMRVEVDWNRLGLGAPETLMAENAVHSTGFRLEKRTDDEGNGYEEAVFFERAEEYAKIEDGILVFPMTRHDYRMIVISKE